MTNVSGSEERIEGFSKDRGRLLKLLLEEKSRRRQEIKRFPRNSAEGCVRQPVSWAQQRLWFIDQLEGGSTAYHRLIALRLKGELDQRSLQRAFDSLLCRHEVLRTKFVVLGGIPQQEIAPELKIELKKIDLRQCQKDERRALVERHKIEEAQGKFDLCAGPLIRGRLVRLQEREHVLLVTLHHIVSDGWSIDLLSRELAELYNAHRYDRVDSLEPLRVQYADYAQWQRQWLQGEELEIQLSYWRARLDGAAPQLDLPADRPRPPIQSYAGENYPVAIDAQLCARLKALAKQHEVTLFMVLYAGWAALLSRLSGQKDIIIGTPIANRQRPELERLIGFFANTLVLRTQVRSEMLIEEFLDQVKEVTLGAYNHQDLPFERIVEALQPHRSLSQFSL